MIQAYRFVGSMLGLPEPILLQGAGLAQLIDDLLNKKDINNMSVASVFSDLSIFDQPEDQAAISLGIELWNAYGVDLARDNFIESLINAKGIKKR
ncbi:MAG: polymorphic toxin type 44 domain-containing protein [Anaerolineaceae bacterium]